MSTVWEPKATKTPPKRKKLPRITLSEGKNQVNKLKSKRVTTLRRAKAVIKK